MPRTTAVVEGDSMPDQQKTRESSAPSTTPATATATAAPAVATSSAPQGKVKRKRRGFAAVSRSVFKGPRMLGRRIKNFLTDDMHVGVSFQKMPPTEATRELATMELLAIYHRWLRGVQALLAILVFLLSLMSIPGTATLVNVTIFVISQCACMIIAKTYHVKAQFSGLTNVLFEGRNIFTSPFFFEMVAEIILWNIQTPPIVVFWATFFDLLDYFIFLRLYSVILYLNNAAYVYRTFCRAMEAMSDLPLSTSFLVRTALVYHRYRVGVTFLLTSWLTVGFMYAKAESVSVGTGLWFSFQTLTTLGYGDATPVTVAGRAVVIIAGLCGFFILAYVIVCAQSTLMATDAEYNMQVLARCHDLTHTLRRRSARVIQFAWKLHRARRQASTPPTKKQQLKVIVLSALLTNIIAALRRARHNLRAAQRDFRESSVNPLTGLSAYQYNTYVYETHRAARRLQRIKDVDRVYLAIKDRDVPASSLTREDIESILMPHGAGTLDEDILLPYIPANTASGGGSSGSGDPSPRGGSPQQNFMVPDGAASPAEVQVWTQRMEKLEKRCAELTSLLDVIAAVSDTHPPSMAVSQA